MGNTHMTRETLAEQMRDFVCDSLFVDRDRVTDSASFAVDLGADSLDVAELTVDLEGKYGIVIPNDEFGCMDTFGELVDSVYKQLAAGGAAS